MLKQFKTATTTLAAGLAMTTYLLAPLAAQTTQSAAPGVQPGQATAAPPAVTKPAAKGSGSPLTALTVPITGTSTTGGTLTGTLALTSFAVQNGQLVALGTVSGLLTTASGTTSIIANAILPVTMGQASCDILNLTLGPLSLNLLGLQINLNQVVLNITAQPGPGNLLGNLLCSVANLLNNPNGLANLLNQILAAL